MVTKYTDSAARARPRKVLMKAATGMAATPAASEAKAMAKQLEGCELVVVEGAGHMVPLEKPEEFAHCLSGFWE